MQQELNVFNLPRKKPICVVVDFWPTGVDDWAGRDLVRSAREQPLQAQPSGEPASFLSSEDTIIHGGECCGFVSPRGDFMKAFVAGRESRFVCPPSSFNLQQHDTA